MTTSKRLTNTTGLKVAFIPATETKGDRFKLTQMNNKKSITISAGYLNIISFICGVLDGIEELESYSLLVDNTQNKYYLFSIDFKGDSFDNILSNFTKF